MLLYAFQRQSRSIRCRGKADTDRNYRRGGKRERCGLAERSVIGPRLGALKNHDGKISTDRGGCGLVADRNFPRDGKNPRGGRWPWQFSPPRHQRDQVAPDRTGSLLSPVRPVLWLFGSIPGLIRLLFCATLHSGWLVMVGDFGLCHIIPLTAGSV